MFVDEGELREVLRFSKFGLPIVSYESHGVQR